MVAPTAGPALSGPALSSSAPSGLPPAAPRATLPADRSGPEPASPPSTASPPSSAGSPLTAPPSLRQVRQGPVYCVVNAGSGRETGEDKARRLREELQRAGRKGEVWVAPPGQAIATLVRRAVERAAHESGIVLVAGGDGTVSSVARLAVPHGVPLGVIPEGTFNLLARTHGIPEEASEAIRTTLAGKAIPVQVGRVNGLLFLVNASLGLYPKLLADREELKSLLGRSRFVALIAGIVTLLGSFRPLDVRLDIDGRRQRLRTTSLFIGNNRLQLERLGLEAASASEQGQLVLLNAPPFGTFTALKLMIQAALGRLGPSADFRVTAFRDLEVEKLRRIGKRRKLGIAIDGERFRIDSPARISIEPRPLWLLVPADDQAGPAPKPEDERSAPGAGKPAS